MSNLYIISGCNGAGKTTVSYTILPEILNCNEFVNADEIAKGLSPFRPENAAIQSGRLMLEKINHLIELEKDFAFETTLSTKSYKNGLRNFFNIFKPIVDEWLFIDNSGSPYEIVAEGNQRNENILNLSHWNILKKKYTNT